MKKILLILCLFFCASTAKATTVYISQTGGTYSGTSGTNCINGVTSTESIATFNSASLVAGNTYYLCGVITTAVNFTGSGGTSGSPINFIFDTGARVSLPTCGQGTSCFNINSASYVTIKGLTACGAGTSCATTENASLTGGYPLPTGAIEATQTGTGLTYCGTCSTAVKQSNIFYVSGGSNVTVENLIIRNVYIHPASSAGLADPTGGGGAFPAVYLSNENAFTLHDCDIHDNDSGIYVANGPNYNTLSFYNNIVFNHNWGVKAGTYGGQTTSVWAIHDNEFLSTNNWDQNADNAHHDQGLFLSRGGGTCPGASCTQGQGLFNRIAFYNNWLTCQTGNDTTAAFYFSGGPVTNLYLYNNVFDYSCNSTKGWSDDVLTVVPGGPYPTNSYAGNTSSTMIWANNTILDALNPPGNSGGCYSFSAIMEFVNNAARTCSAFVYWQNYDGLGGNGFSGYFDYNIYGEPGTGTTAGYWQNDGFSTNLSTKTFSAWQANLVTNGCNVSSNGCETHSQYFATTGALELGANGVPTSTSPLLNAGVNLTALCSTDTLLAALCSDTSLGNTVVPTSRPSSGAWSVGAFQGSGSPSGVLAVSPNPVNFGPITVGSSATPQTVTLTNNGTASLTSLTITLADTTDYAISSNTCGSTLTVSSTCTYSLGFKPLSSGTLNTTVTYTYSGGTGSPYVASVTGSGGAGSYYVQGANTTPNTNQSSVAVTLNSQLAGDGNLCKVAWYDSTSTLTSITSSNGNVYNQVSAPVVYAGFGTQVSYFATSIHAGTETITANLNTSANDPEINCMEYSGVTSVLGSVSNAASSLSLTSGPLAVSSANAVLVASTLVAGSVTAVEAGWTQRFETASGNVVFDLKPGMAGSYTATATQESSPTTQYIIQLIALGSGAVTLPTPVMTPSGGSYTGGRSVNIAVPGFSSATICITTNGTTPSGNGAGGCVNGTAYGPGNVPVLSSENLQAIATQSGDSDSPVNNQNYNITPIAAPNWPLKASGRVLEDQSNTHFMMIGDAAWTAMCSMTPTQMATYFADRAANGFNAVLMEAIPSGPDGDGCPNTGAAQDGILPFTACISCTYPSGANENNYNYADPNSAYFAELDAAINLAKSYGLTVFLGTFSTAGTNAAGTSITSGPLVALRLTGNSNTNATSFGQYIGNRYKTFTNIVYVTGEDFQSRTNATTYNGYTDNQLVSAIATGIAAEDTNHLMTEELDYLISYGSLDSAFSGTQTINAVYSYAGYDTQLIAYGASSQPNLLIEGYYEYNQVYNYLNPFPIAGVNNGACTGTGSQQNIPPLAGSPLYDRATRLTMWWGVTAGSLGGQIYGSCVMGNTVVPSGFAGYIDTPMAAQIWPFVQFWSNLPWWNMVPDTTNTVVTSGYGTYQAASGACSALGTGSAGPCNLFGDNYVTTLWNTGGSVAVIYVPTAPVTNGSGGTNPTTVNWTTTHQTMDGFGAEDWNCCEALTQAQANTFFSPSSGIGLSIIRTGNYGCPSTGACTATTGNVPDLGTLQKATALGATVDLNIASPPASLKYSGSFSDGTAGASGSCLATSTYSAYATYTVQWIQMLKANSVPISVLDVANEPDSPSPTSNSLGACFWTAAQLDLYIGTYLGPALTTAGLSSVKVMFPNEGYWFGGSSGDLYSTCLADPTCAQYVGYIAMQGYGTSGAPDGFGTGYCCSTATAPPSNTNHYHVWQSEVNGGATYNGTAGLWNWDPSMSPDAILWARNIHDYIVTGNVNGWEYWELADCCPSESGAPFNDGLMEANLSTTSKRMYVLGNWSTFVRPGWVRVDTGSGNPQSGVYVTAFKNPSTGQFAIVAVNQNGSNTAQQFNFTNFPGVSSVIPYVTSSSLNLVAQSAATVTAGSFSYTLPATSVTTFTGTATGTGLTVNMGEFSSAVTAQWYDPTNGTYTAISGSPFTNSGSHVFTTPGNNSRGEQDFVLLLQAGTSPTATLSATSMSFGSQILNTSATQSVTLTNTGTGNLVVTNVALTGNGFFSQSFVPSCGALPFTLTPSSVCSISATFRPTTAGSVSGTITITDNASSSPQAISLSGTGVLTVAPPASLTVVPVL